ITFAELQPVDGATKRYRVVRVSPVTGPQPARFGLTFGPFIKEPLPKAGDVVQLEYHATPSLDNVWAAVGGGHQIVKDGTWYEDPHPIAADEREVRWPVIAAGNLGDGRILFVAVDGRHPERAVGMTRPEFAKLLGDYGVVDALAFDSGGSVTMVSRLPFGGPVAVRNRPSDDDGERFIANGLFVYSSAPPDTLAGALSHYFDAGKS
ncbi:MAG: phosphodiester glycosidase family protein, partial [Candidatus Eremiobacteraeota bacterium]|nr:phosphodiester glycosidase family protein [Candidatus Eremiobacteraeota bacterium]